jgi:hypothetical protein
LKAFTSDTLLIIDNLNILLTSYETSPLDYLELFNDLFSLTTTYPFLSLAVGTNRDLFTDPLILDCYRSLVKTEFDLTLEVTRNISGYTKDVHGQINIIRRSATADALSVKNVKYRLTENKVEIFEHFVI